MRSVDHEGLVALFRNREVLGAELVETLRGDLLPRYDSVAMVSDDLSQARPAAAHADAVMVLREGTQARLALVIEVQLRWSLEKTYAWPLDQAAVRRRHQCEALVLVIAPSRAIARRAAKPIALGGGNVFRALVVGPEEIPPVTDLAVARAAPELAVLSSMHGRDRIEVAVAAAVTAEEAVRGLPEQTARLYFDLIEHALSRSARRALEELMSLPGYQWKSDFALKHRGEGRAEGKAEGKAEGLREALLLVLTAKFGPLDATWTSMIESASHPQLLDWTRRSATVTSVEELFST